MNCREFEKKIPDFIGDKLNFMQLQEFTAHANECPACKEELTIQILIDKGLAKLEEGSAFDLQKEMDTRMRDATAKITFHQRFLKLERVTGVFLILIFLGIIGVIIFM